MGVALSVQNYLQTKGVEFTLVPHDYSEGSFNTARAANIDAHNLAKAVVFRDEDFHYTLCVLPSRNKVLRHTLNQILDRHLELADEEELGDLFIDCEPGAIPALGQAYGIHVIWDDELLQNDCIYIEAGDHQHLIRISTEQFLHLMQNTWHDHFSAVRQRRNRNKQLQGKRRRESDIPLRNGDGYTEDDR